MISAILSSLLITSAHAITIENPLDIVVQGLKVNANSVTYAFNYEDSVRYVEITQNDPIDLPGAAAWPYEIRLDKHSEFTFIRGNKISLGGQITLRRDGGISFVIVDEPKLVEWKMPDGQIIMLNCGQKMMADGSRRPRFLKFFANSQIESGCSNISTMSALAVSGEKVELHAQSGTVDFNENGLLQYVQRGHVKEFHVQGRTVALAPNHEIQYYKSGLPQFFTLALGQRLTFETASGELVVSDPPGVEASLSLSEDQRLERSFTPTTLRLGAVQVGPGRVLLDTATNSIAIADVPSQLTRVADQELRVTERAEFYPNGQIKALVLESPQKIRVGQKAFLATRMVRLDQEQRIRALQMAEAQKVNIQGLPVEALSGDVLVFTANGELDGLLPGSINEERTTVAERPAQNI